MKHTQLVKAYLVLCISVQMSIDQALPQLATVGTTFRLIRGEDIEDFAASLERSRAFHTCGMDKLCSHVARLEKGGKYEMIKTNSEAKNAQVSALWEKEQPELENIALNKNARASSSDLPRLPSLAVDGNKDMRYFKNYCFGSQSPDPNPWWRVDLGKNALVHSVSITNSGGEHSSLATHLSNVDIRIGFEDNAGVNPICRKNITINEPITVNFICDSEMIGQFVFVEKHQVKIYLCEVEVYGLYV